MLWKEAVPERGGAGPDAAAAAKSGTERKKREKRGKGDDNR